MEITIFGDVALWGSVILNLPAALFIGFGLAEGHVMKRHWLFKVSLLVMMAGLIGQFARSYIAIATGASPTDAEIPFWFLKDFGIILMGVYYLLKSLRLISCNE